MLLIKITNIMLLEHVAAHPRASHPSFPSLGEKEPLGSLGGFSLGRAEFVLQG